MKAPLDRCVIRGRQGLGLVRAALLLAAGTLGCQGSAAPGPPLAEVTETAADSEAAQGPLETPYAIRPRSKALPEEAVALVDRMAADFPSSASALFARGSILDFYGQSNEAAQTWRQCLEADPTFAAAHEQLGLLAMKRGDFSVAAEQLSQACELQPDLPEAGLHLGKALLSLGRAQEAAEVLEKHTAAHPDSTETWFRLGQAQLEIQEYERAKKSYQTAINTYNDCIPAWYGLAQACERLGEAEPAREYRQRFVELDSALSANQRTRRRTDAVTPDGQQSLSRVLTIAADFYSQHRLADVAQEYWREAAKLDPANINCRVALARSLAAEGQAVEAIALYEEACRLQPDSVQQWLGLAMLQQQALQLDAAERSFSKAREIAPEHLATQLALTQFYLSNNRRLPEARRLAQQIVEQHPTAAHYFLLCSACRANGDASDARAALREALRREPRNPQFLAAAEQLGRD